MARVCKLLLATVLAVLPGMAAALGLGDITLNTGLNQRLDAEIEVVGAQPGDMNELKASLAPRETFARYGIDYPQFLTSLDFRATRNERGEDILRVTSRDVIAEPFVTFLVEATWPRGRLLREYTVLLDPPIFLPGEQDTRAMAPAATGSGSTAAGSGAIERSSAPTAAASPPSASRPAPVQPARTGSGARASAARGDGLAGTRYGPVERGESLSRIASRVRPGDATLNQTMLAIYQENPEAFLGNMNLLRQGAVLDIPTAERIRGVNRRAANTALVEETARWRGADTAVAASAGAGAGSSSGSTASATPALQLVAPDGGEGASTLRNQLAEAKAENSALADTVEQQRLELEQAREGLALRDQQLAELQRQLSEAREQLADTGPMTADDDAGAVTAPGATLADGSPAGVEPLAATDTVEGAGDAANDPMMAPTAESAATDPAESPGEPTEASAPVAEAASKPAPAAADPAPAGGGPLDFVFGLLGNPILWLVPAVIALGGAGAMVLRNRRNEPSVDEFDSFPEESDSLDATGAVASADSDTMLTTMEIPLSADAQDDDELARTGDIDPAGATAEVSAFGGPMEAGEFDGNTGKFRPLELAETRESSGDGVDLDLTMTEAFEAEDGNDPVSEADFHMAYGLYDQAADLINQALEREPTRTDLQAKLLEIYFVWGNKDEFRKAAAKLQPSLGAVSGEWEKVVIMGRQICPEDPLFEGDANVGGAIGEAADLDIGLQTQATPYDMDLGGGDADRDEDMLDIGLDELPDPSDTEAPAFGLDSGTADEDAERTAGGGELDLAFGAEDDTTRVDLSGEDLEQASNPEWSPNTSAEIEQDEELTAIARKLEARMTPDAGDTDFGMSLDLGQTIAPEVSAPKDDGPVSVDDSEDDGFGDFFAFTGVVEEAGEDDDSADGSNLLEGDGELLPESSTGEFKIELPEEQLADTVEQRSLAGGDVTGNHVAFSGLAGDGDTEQQPAIAMAGQGLSLAGGDDTLESFMLPSTGDDSDRTSLMSTTSMIANFDPGAETAESRLVDESESDPATAPTVQMPMATDIDIGDISSTADTVSAQVLDLSLARDGGGDVTSTADPVTDIGLPESDDEALDEVGTKLDLARAYIDMGDADSARSILEEVVQEGSTSQRDDANHLLSSLG
jgi:pilus assembly protein FimV